MLHQGNLRLVIVSLVALCFGLAGCSGENNQTSADGAEDQNTEDASDSVADATQVDDNATNAAPVDDGAQTPDTPTAIDFASLTGDAANGKRVFSKCMACHAMQAGQNRVGPSLFEIVGKPAGSVDGFKYSPAMTESDVVWNEEALQQYLENPKTFMPRNRMMFPGVPSAQDRADVIAFLQAPSE